MTPDEFNFEASETLKWLEFLKHTKHASGCFFVLSENVYPFYWDGYFREKVDLLEAWSIICDSWLSKIYSTYRPLQELFPYIIKGQVEDGIITLGNDCPFYLSEIRFCFKLEPDCPYEVDSSLAIDLDIPRELAYMIKMMNKDCPYFEQLPQRVKFHKKDYGSEIEKKEIFKNIVGERYAIVQERSKRNRVGALPRAVLS